MQIPSLLEQKYNSHLKLRTFVSSALGNIEAHLNSVPLVFFPEYTDHGIKHVESTLQTAVDFATEESHELLTPFDAAILATAVGLHDLGMYLTRDGFQTLISPENSWIGIPFFDHITWPALWDSFFARATRFDDRQLKILFGDSYRPVRPLPPEGEPWSEFDFLLVGEFLRENHPRLAHEISIHGLPAKAGRFIAICEANDEEVKFLADIAGLVARSHGIPLRACMNYLEKEYRNKIDPRGAHPIFLGALLRIADYFQIQATRAPYNRTDVTTFRSNFSHTEWRVHQSVTDIHNSGADPEAIKIDARPTDVETFLRLKKWLEGLQKELDQTWAIIGEVFALQTHIQLDKFGLRVRRVKSNLDDSDSFSKSVPYVPQQLAFEAASADLLKLLVAPLYGDEPSIAIRELMQNSIDAVRENEDLLKKYPALSGVERYKQDADVVVDIKTNDKGDPVEIIVTDRGVGMTLEVIRDYFLRAGASFRKSSMWRQEHEDAAGHSQVLRTGRFGVGALAAFLLGDEIEVTTRHIQANENEAITFVARLDDASISLMKTSAPAGTKIRIAVPDKYRAKVKDLLPGSWDKFLEFNSALGHYFLREPSVNRMLNGENIELQPRAWLPQPEEGNSIDWRFISTPHFDKVFWTYSGPYPSIASNGIIITSSFNGGFLLPAPLQNPRICVFDKDGYLPVTLQRTSLQSSHLPFTDELVASITIDLIACAIVSAPETAEDIWFHGTSPALMRADGPAKWAIGKDGFVINDEFLLGEFKPDYVVLGVGGPRGYLGWGNYLRAKLPGRPLLLSLMPDSLSDQNNRIKGLFESVMTGSPPMWGLKYRTLLGAVPEAVVTKVKGMKPGKSVSKEIDYLSGISAVNGWFSFVFDSASDSKITNETIAEISTAIETLSSDGSNPIMFSVVQPTKWVTTGVNDVLSKTWRDIWGASLIPFNVKNRRRQTPKDHATLTQYIDLWDERVRMERRKAEDES